MARERFPRQRLRSSLQKMTHELDWWRASYLEAEQTTQSQWLASRFGDRAAILWEIGQHLVLANEMLADFPRTS